MKIQFHRIDTNVVVGLLVREFCCSGTDVSAKVLVMYAGARTSSMEPQWLAAGLSQSFTYNWYCWIDWCKCNGRICMRRRYWSACSYLLLLHSARMKRSWLKTSSALWICAKQRAIHILSGSNVFLATILKELSPMQLIISQLERLKVSTTKSRLFADKAMDIQMMNTFS